MACTGIRRSTLYLLIKRGEFPAARVKLTERTRGWVAEDVQAWIAERTRKTNSQEAA
jgi:predicted DNA-binding transcriptional regulator AlpA